MKARETIVPLLAALVLAAGPLFLTNYQQDLVVKIMVLSVFALSLELLVGMTGLVSPGTPRSSASEPT
jgi:branched-chain amino acid transport system permease protein